MNARLPNPPANPQERKLARALVDEAHERLYGPDADMPREERLRIEADELREAGMDKGAPWDR